MEFRSPPPTRLSRSSWSSTEICDFVPLKTGVLLDEEAREDVEERWEEADLTMPLEDDLAPFGDCFPVALVVNISTVHR